MKRSARIICLILAGIFVFGVLAAVLLSAVSYAAEKSVRSETVYVDLAHDGTPVSILASVYLTNPEKLDTVTDRTILTELKNVAGTEQPDVDGQTAVWKAAGGDVAYQGRADAPLPFAIRIRYFLDGEPMQAEEMAGKSGHVRIEVAVENSDAHQVEVEGETVTMYTPFTVVSLFTVGEDFRSVTAENAKISSEAGSSMVTAITLPGLAASLGVEAEGKLSESFALEADVNDFELGEIMFVAMNGIVDAADVEEIDDVKTLLDGFNELQDGMNKLERGARSLRDGVEEYGKGISKYVDGVDAIAGGVDELKKGIDTLSSGVSQIGGFGSMSSELTAAAGTISSIKGEIEKAISGTSVSEEQIAGAIASVGAAMDPPMTDEQVAALTQAVMSYIQNVSGKPDLSGLDKLADALTSAASSVDALSGGIAQLQSGISRLASGAGELAEGASKLVENGGALTKGVDELYQGAAALRRGIRTLNQDGVTKLVEETSGVNVSLSRKDALFDLSEAYTSYSGLTKDGTGSVRFVLTTEDIFVPAPLETPAPEQDDADASADGTAISPLWYCAGGAAAVAVFAAAFCLLRKRRRES